MGSLTSSFRSAGLWIGMLCLPAAGIQAKEVGAGPSFGSPGGVLVEADGKLVVSDFGMEALVRVDPATGFRTVLSDAVVGQGPLLESPGGIALESSGSLVVLDAVRRAILRVDAITGDRTLVSDENTGTGPPIASAPGVLGIEPDGSIVFVSQVPRRVVRVDPVSGDRTIVSDDVVGSGPPLDNTLWSIAVSPTGELIVASGGGFLPNLEFTLMFVDPLTGDRTVLSSETRGSGPPLFRPIGMTVEPDGTVLVATTSTSVTGEADTSLLAVDGDTGDRSVVSDATTGSGPTFRTPEAIVLTAPGSIVVSDWRLAALVAVDRASGDRRILAGGPVGIGPRFSRLRGIAVEGEGSLVVTDSGLKAILRVDPLTGDREIVSDAARGTGPELNLAAVGDIVVQADGTLMVLDNDVVVSVDPVTGARRVVSDDTTGEGSPFRIPTAIAAEAGGTLIVLDGAQICVQRLAVCALVNRALLRVDPADGDRTIASGGGFFGNRRGGGVALFVIEPLFASGEGFTGVAAQPDGELVAGLRRSLARVDPTSGDRTVLSGPPGGGGPALGRPASIAVDATGALLVIDEGPQGHGVMLIDSMTGDRTRLSDRFTASGPQLVSPVDIAVPTDGSPVVVNAGGDAVLRVDRVSGERSVLSR